jgi:hypothetical protein
MPASKSLERSLVCTCPARFVLPGGINDDFICNKVEKQLFPSNSKVCTWVVEPLFPNLLQIKPSFIPLESAD